MAPFRYNLHMFLDQKKTTLTELLEMTIHFEQEPFRYDIQSRQNYVTQPIMLARSEEDEL